MKVTIVGAGLGGLTLARVLYRNGVEVEVFETAAGPDAHRRGGPLALPPETGQAAVRAAGLLTHLPAITLDGGAETRVLDSDGAVRLIDVPPQAIAVDRGDLRDMLLASLPEDTVHWGRRVVATRDGGEIVLARGRVLRTEALVGADGPGSVVRPLLSDAVAAYSGITAAEVRVRDARRYHPELTELVGDGVMVAVGDDRRLIAYGEPTGELCVRAALRVPAGRAPDTVEALLEHFADWHPDLRRLLAEAAGDPVAYPVHRLPAGHRWPRVPGVTLLGAAAYRTSPFTADGENLALLDGAELGLAIAEFPGDLERALAGYEERMFPRGEAAPDELLTRYAVSV